MTFFQFLPLSSSFFQFLPEETGRNTIFPVSSILPGRNQFLPEVSEPCLNHDYNFVDHCLSNIIMPKLTATGCRVTTLHQRTDGCAGQYKSKHSFGIISISEQHLNVHHIANYNASGHGKGEVDQAAGFLKTAAKTQS